ncbi:hypothetical protein [Frigidibacter mobilis]|uniref:hypothetical protein n=1 Tax=Frigidibacter mobilis TaxID=1335048 RepID=UPI0014136DFB|nr:hypothetical protein [Frigidibacter mobilis]
MKALEVEPSSAAGRAATLSGPAIWSQTGQGGYGRAEHWRPGQRQPTTGRTGVEPPHSTGRDAPLGWWLLHGALGGVLAWVWIIRLLGGLIAG